jgi:hypothetical protein
VLIGDASSGSFKGFWAEFEGKEVTKHEEEEERLSYMLFEVPWGSRGDETGYRVHKADERNISQPKYKLLPTGDDPHRFDREEKYHVAYSAHGLLSSWPIFAKHVEDEDVLPVRNIDPGSEYHRRWLV